MGKETKRKVRYRPQHVESEKMTSNQDNKEREQCYIDSFLSLGWFFIGKTIITKSYIHMYVWLYDAS
jgi:hypothetical protein